MHEETGEGVVDYAIDPMASPERRVSAAETLARIEEAFKGDGDALKVMAGMAVGKSPKEIQEEAGMNGTRYASTQRRIRRRLAREFPDRGVDMTDSRTSRERLTRCLRGSRTKSSGRTGPEGAWRTRAAAPKTWGRCGPP